VKIGILSRNHALYSTRRLAQAARVRGHTVQIIDTLAVAVDLGLRPDAAKGSSRYRLPEVDGIIPRIGASITPYGLAVVRQFEDTGAVSTAGSEAIAQSRDKLQSLQLMGRAGLPIPRTVVVAQLDDVRAAVDMVGGLPVIIKLVRGTQGRGVILAPDLASVEAIALTFHRFKEQMLIQEFITEANGQDTRIIVVGHQCVAAMRRSAAAGEFRSNLHLGGTAVPIVLDSATKKLALRAAQAHTLGVAGVDVIASARGPLLLEVNSSPGLEGIERTTGVDVARSIVQHLEKLISQKAQRARRQRRHKGRV
jgi:ribosomal protein S6--L-glutamate ligase